MVELWAREREISEGIANCGKLKKEGKVREQRESRDERSEDANGRSFYTARSCYRPTSAQSS